MVKLRWLLPLIGMLSLASPVAAGVRVSARSGAVIDVGHGFLRVRMTPSIYVLINTQDRVFTVWHTEEKLVASAKLKELCKSTERVLVEQNRRGNQDQPARQPNARFVPHREIVTVRSERQDVFTRQIEVKRNYGSRSRVAGRPAIAYEVLVNGDTYLDVWLNTDPEVREALKTLNWRFMDQLNACLIGTGLLETNQLKADLVEASKEYGRLWRRGFVVKRERQGRVDGYSAKSIEVTDHPKSYFDPNTEGYRRYRMLDALRALFL